jgi:hypothetical protein
MRAYDQSEGSLGRARDFVALDDNVDFDFEADTLTSAQFAGSHRLKIVGVGSHTQHLDSFIGKIP